MFRQSFALLASADFADLFLVAFFVLVAQTTVKFLTKLPVLCNEPPDAIEQRAARFDCLRLGIDLAFVGFVAGLGTLRMGISNPKSIDVHAIADLQTLFIIIQVVLILLATLFTAIYRSPMTSYKRGIWIPSLIGTISVIFALATFLALSK
jgi:hypothetical protein